MADRDFIYNMTTDPFFRSIMTSTEITPFFQLGFFQGSDYYGYYPINECQLVLPYTNQDRYTCYPEPIGKNVEMASGRMVWEHRGFVTKIDYQYDYLPPDMWRTLSSFLRSGEPFGVAYLPDHYDSYQYVQDDTYYAAGLFTCESLTSPKMLYAEMGYDAWDPSAGEWRYESSKPMWHGIQFTLRSYNSSPKINIG